VILLEATRRCPSCHFLTGSFADYRHAYPRRNRSARPPQYGTFDRSKAAQKVLLRPSE
jgi:hypothetical protein